MPAGRYDFTGDKAGVRVGETFGRSLTYKEATGAFVNLTGYSGKMQVRSKVDGTVLLELSTDNNRMTLGGVAGTITLAVSATDMAGMTAGLGVYDLDLTSAGGVVTYLIYGDFEFLARVTV
jgi:hypothetical protein